MDGKEVNRNRIVKSHCTTSLMNFFFFKCSELLPFHLI